MVFPTSKVVFPPGLTFFSRALNYSAVNSTIFLEGSIQFFNMSSISNKPATLFSVTNAISFELSGGGWMDGGR
jgi:hypothetical protein